MKKCIVCFVLFLGLVVYVSAFGADTIKIGIIDTYSGAGATFTYDILDGFKMAINKVNSSGGVLGKKIEFTTRDDKFKTDIAVSLARELIQRENVDLLMGGFSSSVALAISEYVKKEKIPFVVTFAKSEKISGEKGHRYVFSVTDNSAMAAKAAAQMLSKLPYTKYWIAGEDYDYSHSLANSIWDNLKPLKPDVKILGKTWWKVGEADVVPYITSILTAKPEALIVTTGGAGMVNFMKTAKNMGIDKKLPIYMHTAIETSVLQALGSEAPEGILGAAAYVFYYPETAENKTFVDEFQKTYKRYPKVGAFYGFTAANLIVKAYEKAGVVDKEKFINALEGLTVDSPVGKVQMRACDHQLVMPMFCGVTKKDPRYDHLIGSNLTTIPGKDVVPTCEEVLKLRK
jgi:branched-chain amino acid transport system substrate-binding protein